jgi:3-hydroxyisobutyrate dehydrogenase-like beta-hydroxyacid dehydrogenase
MRIGFIGLGSQGGPMARRIVEAGYPTTLWARRPDTLAQYADTAAGYAATPAELGAASDLVCLCVTGDDDVRAVIAGEDGVLSGMAAGSIIAVHSTVHPDTCRRLGEQAAAHGVQLVDAPVSGGGFAATKGNLLVMVGGDDDTVQRCTPVFATYGDPIAHLGPLGSGQVAKLLNNLLFTANLATAADTFALGRALGVDPAQLGQVITHGTANSFALGRVADSGGTLDRLAAHAGGLLRKDVRLVGELADQAGSDPGIVRAAAEATLRMMGQS